MALKWVTQGPVVFARLGFFKTWQDLTKASRSSNWSRRLNHNISKSLIERRHCCDYLFGCFFCIRDHFLHNSMQIFACFLNVLGLCSILLLNYLMFLLFSCAYACIFH